MASLSFTSIAWDQNPRIAVLADGAATYSIDWGDGTVVSGSLASRGTWWTALSSGALYTPTAYEFTDELVGAQSVHDYAGDVGPRTITVEVTGANIVELIMRSCGITAILDSFSSQAPHLRVVELSKNFLTDLGDLLACAQLIHVDVSHNWLSGDAPVHSGVRTLLANANGFGRLEFGDAALVVKAQHNPLKRLLNQLPSITAQFEAYNCCLRQEYVDRLAIDMLSGYNDAEKFVAGATAPVIRSDLNPALTPAESLFAPTHPNAIPVVWIDYANKIIQAPFDGSDWPDPAVVGPYYIDGGVGSNTDQGFVAVAKAGSSLHCWVGFVPSSFWPGYPIYRWVAGNPPGSRVVHPTIPNSPTDTIYFDFGSSVTVSAKHRSLHVSGGDNVVPAAASQTSYDNLVTAAGAHWSGGSASGEVYNISAQDTGVPRPPVHAGSGTPKSDVTTLWWGSHAHTGDASTNSIDNFPGMLAALGHHLVTNGAVHLGVLVFVWYRTTGDISEGSISYLRLNGQKCRPLGMPTEEHGNHIVQEVFWLRPEDVNSYSLTLEVSFDAAMDDISYLVCPVRDADPAMFASLDRAPGDNNMGRSNWQMFASSSDLMVVGASKPAAHKDAVTAVNLSFPGSTNQTPWGSLTPTNSGSGLLVRAGYRYGAGDSTNAAYWTRDAGGVAGGATRAIIMRPRKTYPVEAAAAWFMSSVELGHGFTYTHRAYPEPLALLGTGGDVYLKEISATDLHIVAIGSDDNLYVGGYNAFGRLGLGSGSVSTNVPLQQVSGITDVVGVWASDENSLAVCGDGSIYMAGRNQKGIFGTVSGDPGYAAEYDTFQLLDKTGLQAVIGYRELLVLDAAGDVWHRGSNQSAQGGFTADGSDHKTWTQVGSGILADVTQIFAYPVDYPTNAQLYAVNGDGGIYTWGRNSLDTTGAIVTATDPIVTPTVIIGLDASCTAVVATSNPNTLEQTLYAVRDGDLWAAGYNEDGNFGQNIDAYSGTFTSQAAVLTPFPETVDRLACNSRYPNGVYVRGISGKLYSAGENIAAYLDPWRQGRDGQFEYRFRRTDEADTEYWMDGGELWTEGWKGAFPVGAKLMGLQSAYFGNIIWMEVAPPSAPAGTGRKIRSWVVD